MSTEPINEMCNTPDVHGDRCRCRLTLPEQAGSDFAMGYDPTPDQISPALIDQLDKLGRDYGPMGVAHAAALLVVRSNRRAAMSAFDDIGPDPDPIKIQRGGIRMVDDADADPCPDDDHTQACRCHRGYPPIVGVDAEPEHDTAWFCDTAREIIGQGGERRRDYGGATESFDRIARLWSVVLGVEVTGEQVALCMIQLKLARLFQKVDHTDSWVDIIGYAALGGQISHNR